MNVAGQPVRTNSICFVHVRPQKAHPIANPILSFNIYNPDKEIITDFTHCELQFFAQSLWFINGVRTALMLVVSISQFDIAVAKVVYTEFTGLFTVYCLLSEKTFAPLNGDEEADGLLDCA